MGGQPSPEQLRAAYDAVCARFPPAMHHFFLEMFRDPGGLGGATWLLRPVTAQRSSVRNAACSEGACH